MLPGAVFIFTSTNKVYGDLPNSLPLARARDAVGDRPGAHLRERHPRGHVHRSLACTASSARRRSAADILVQEYGRYFGMRTACFRGGTLTGPCHSATELHGFLAYVMRCAMTGTAYTVFGYKGKQVRDAIHSLDLIRAFDEFFREPRVAEVYNIGGGRFSHASVLEAIRLSEEITGEKIEWTYREESSVGDHIWWIGDNGRFQSHYPEWKLEYDVRRILEEIHELNADRWSRNPQGLAGASSIRRP